MQLRNRKWTIEELLAKRRDVLALWPTGKEIDLEEAIAYRKGLPNSKSWVEKTTAARESGSILVEGLVGHPTIEQTIEHLKFAEEAGVDLHTIIADTYSRRNMFARAQKALEEGLSQGRPMLNGCPIVVHGLQQARRIAEASSSPMLYVSSMVEAPMLLAEMAMACGFQISNDSLDSLLKASKNYPLEEKLKNDQYSARLAGYYTERGAPVHVKSAAHLAGWEPHGMRIVVGVLQALLIAEQGVKHLSIALGQVLHLVQDVAGIIVLRELAGDYLRRFGHEDVSLFITAYPYQGEWSRDLDRASGISAWASIIGIMGGADWIVVKSVEEAIATPTKHGAATSIKMAGQLLQALGKQRLQQSKELDTEKEMLRLEAKAIVEEVIHLGEGDVAVGLPRAIARGVIDIPFQPWTHLLGKVLTVRDGTGAIRYLEHGNVPLPKEVIDYHRQMVMAREKDEGRKADLDMVIEDVNFLSRQGGAAAGPLACGGGER
ncbi:MAG: hypothetical protein HY673_00350 [Chloroflexi bacterium]|nr:hypothetical protein [Chloroflexota bacterium]